MHIRGATQYTADPLYLQYTAHSSANEAYHSAYLE